jgi:hypothetical protein
MALIRYSCDRCRLKKARCSGGPAPCNKCKRDRVICIISKDKSKQYLGSPLKYDPGLISSSELDTQPKSPEYVRMVESQRDLLLKAVHELRQKSKACEQTGANWDAASDINRVLQELGVHNDHSEFVRETILDELASTQLEAKDTTSEAPRLSNSTQSLNTPSFNHIQETNFPSVPSETFDFDRLFQSDQNFDNDVLFAANAQPHDSPPSHENILMSDWTTSSPPLFNFQDPADLDYPNMQDFEQTQTWQNGSTHQAHLPDAR